MLDLKNFANIPSAFYQDEEDPYFNSHYYPADNVSDHSPALPSSPALSQRGNLSVTQIGSSSFKVKSPCQLERKMNKQTSFNEIATVYHYPDLEMIKGKVNSIPPTYPKTLVEET